VKYLYYPGCSLKSTGRAYEESALAVTEALGMRMDELEDWNCCGATNYMSISELKSFALSGRNLALANRQANSTESVSLVAPCAACYLGLTKAKRYIEEYPEIRSKVDGALNAAGLEYRDHVRVRHLLDVLVNDFDQRSITEQVKVKLAGMKVACYYGCQIVRPYSEFDDQHNPTSMERLFKSLGMDVVDWPLKTRCCGGTLTGTVSEVGQRLSYILLREATRRGANVIVTACPLCQFNLECYQSEMSKRFNDSVHIPVTYFTQLMGLALGIPRKKLGLHRLFVPIPDGVESPAAGGAHVLA
jgi:heterodisulfide reductase subunit B